MVGQCVEHPLAVHCRGFQLEDDWLHSVDMAKPSEAMIAEQTRDAGQASRLQNFSVPNTVQPFEVEEAQKTAELRL